MYSAKDEREGFSNRLLFVLTGLGWRKMSPTLLAKQFNIRAGDTCAVTVHAARKWLRGASIPAQARLSVLASWLQVEPNWLRFGKTQSTDDNVEIVASEDLELLRELAQMDRASKELAHEMIAVMLKATKRSERRGIAENRKKDL